MPRTACLLLGASILLSLPRTSFSQDVARYYEENCSACHTIGGGAQGGPDLKGVTSRVDRGWLARFMLDPEAVVKSGDAYAQKILKESDGNVMPASEGLTPEMADALLRFIEERSGEAPAREEPPPAEAPPSAERVEAGRRLFVGSDRLAAGGPPCLGCHRLAGMPGWNGGTLGPDLSPVHERLGGRRGLDGWLTNPPTRVMKAVYRGASLDAAERDALAAFLAVPRAARTTPLPPAAQFAATGTAGAVLAIAAIAFAWRRRFRGRREPLVAGVRRRLAGEQR